MTNGVCERKSFYLRTAKVLRHFANKASALLCLLEVNDFDEYEKTVKSIALFESLAEEIKSLAF